jgi:hypothetical protein
MKLKGKGGSRKQKKLKTTRKRMLEGKQMTLRQRKELDGN